MTIPPTSTIEIIGVHCNVLVIVLLILFILPSTCTSANMIRNSRCSNSGTNADRNWIQKVRRIDGVYVRSDKQQFYQQAMMALRYCSINIHHEIK